MTEFITQHKLNGWRKKHRCIHSVHRERSDRVTKLTVEEVALSRAIPTNCVLVLGALLTVFHTQTIGLTHNIVLWAERVNDCLVSIAPKAMDDHLQLTQEITMDGRSTYITYV